MFWLDGFGLQIGEEKKKSFLVAFQAVLACRANSAEMVQITVLRYYDFKNTQRREMQ